MAAAALAPYYTKLWSSIIASYITLYYTILLYPSILYYPQHLCLSKVSVSVRLRLIVKRYTFGMPLHQVHVERGAGLVSPRSRFRTLAGQLSSVESGRTGLVAKQPTVWGQGRVEMGSGSRNWNPLPRPSLSLSIYIYIYIYIYTHTCVYTYIYIYI